MLFHVAYEYPLMEKEAFCLHNGSNLPARAQEAKT